MCILDCNGKNNVAQKCACILDFFARSQIFPLVSTQYKIRLCAAATTLSTGKD